MLIQRFLSLFVLIALPTLAMQRMHDPLKSPLPSLTRLLSKPQLQKSQQVVIQSTNTPWKSKTFKYDDILQFLDDLENGELENRCTDQDLEQINYFIAGLAREGLMPAWGDDPQELERDIEELLGISGPYSFRYASAERSSFELTPALYYGYHETLTCGWFKKTWKKTKKFCKKNKKAIIITAAVVVVATTVVVIAVAASSSAAAGGAATAMAGGGESGAIVGAGGAAAGAAAAIASSSNESNDQHSTRPGANDAIAVRPDPTPPAPPQSPKSEPSEARVEEIVERHIQKLKETIAQERPAIDLARPGEPLSFEESVRVHGVNAAQSICREVMEAVALVAQQPSFIEREIRSAAGAFGLIEQKVGIVADNDEVIEIPGAQMASGVALPVPNPSTAAAAIVGAGYAAYEVGSNASLQQFIANGLDYAKDKVLYGVEYVKDRAVEVADSVVSWATGLQPTTSLESHNGDGVADDRVLQPPDEYFEGFPDRPLPRDPRTQEPVGDVAEPHTQLGTRDSKKGRGKYRQARTFDAEGKEVCRDDYSYHNDPTQHTNPHRHWITPNETGGTPKMEDGAPVPGYNYEQ